MLKNKDPLFKLFSDVLDFTEYIKHTNDRHIKLDLYGSILVKSSTGNHKTMLPKIIKDLERALDKIKNI